MQSIHTVPTISSSMQSCRPGLAAGKKHIGRQCNPNSSACSIHCTEMHRFNLQGQCTSCHNAATSLHPIACHTPLFNYNGSSTSLIMTAIASLVPTSRERPTAHMPPTESVEPYVGAYACQSTALARVLHPSVVYADYLILLPRAPDDQPCCWPAAARLKL